MLRKISLVTVITITWFSIVAGSYAAQHDHDHGADTDGEARSEPSWEGDPYLLAIDPVTDQSLDEDTRPVVVTYEGREFRFAGRDNADAFQTDPKPYIVKVDALMVEQQLPYYPLTECPVSNESLDVMGKPVDMVYRNRVVRFCCGSCKGAFLRNPDAVVSELDEAAVASQRDSYPLETCVVSSETLGSMGEPIEQVYGNRLVRFCCTSCEEMFLQRPRYFLNKLDTAQDENHD